MDSDCFYWRCCTFDSVYQGLLNSTYVTWVLLRLDGFASDEEEMEASMFIYVS